MTAPDQRDNTVLPDMSTSSSVVTATISAPFGQVNIADWLMHLPDREYQHCHMVSLSDILMPAGWTTIQVIWDLSVTDNGNGTCTYHNHVEGHPTADFVAVAQRSGLTIDDDAGACRPCVRLSGTRPRAPVRG
ncbi:MAG TPA: hypothetical protein VMG38_22905 [Trebonia sp.]|nr:hypothetical protein [Trebonia sp.]